MDPKDFCCSYEQAVRLKELGVEQGQSFFYFTKPMSGISVLPMLMHNNKFRGKDCVDAYNVAELGVMLGFSAKCPSSRGEPKYRAELLIDNLERGIVTPEDISNQLLVYPNQ